MGRPPCRLQALQTRATPVQADSVEVFREDVRNLAIIAHVDHGKSTLVDALMKQTAGDGARADRHMDCNQLEKERGITILAKNAAIRYKGVKINLIDTPGHADFSGEVERILNMADGCLLLVDAEEGPKPQTKFVLRKALELGRRTLVCINKVDKPNARPDWVLDATFDLFSALGADDDLCDFPVSYASGLKGMASLDDPAALEADLAPLIDQIIAECPKPRINGTQPLQLLVANLDYNEYIGRICIGRIRSGTLRVGQRIGFQHGPDGELRVAKVTKLWEFLNNDRVEVDEVAAGDICAFAGMEDVAIGDTVVDPQAPLPLPPLVVEEPTVMMEFGINTSPLAGKSADGTKSERKLTSRMLQSRLEREVLTNIALRLEPGTSSESVRVKGRGILQMGILIETMRREGFEIMVGSPEVLLRTDPQTGEQLEPYEEAVVEVPMDVQGVVMEEMQGKGAVLLGSEIGAIEGLIVHTFEIPTRGLVGMQSRLSARTSGGASLHSQFSRWGPLQPEKARLRQKGSIVCTNDGVATANALRTGKHLGVFFTRPGDAVYRSMCVGIHHSEQDHPINLTKQRKVTNVREQNGLDLESIPATLNMTIDDFLGHMETDELLEVTPDTYRLCKRPGAMSKYM